MVVDEKKKRRTRARLIVLYRGINKSALAARGFRRRRAVLLIEGT